MSMCKYVFLMYVYDVLWSFVVRYELALHELHLLA